MAPCTPPREKSDMHCHIMQSHCGTSPRVAGDRRATYGRISKLRTGIPRYQCSMGNHKIGNISVVTKKTHMTVTTFLITHTSRCLLTYDTPPHPHPRSEYTQMNLRFFSLIINFVYKFCLVSS